MWLRQAPPWRLRRRLWWRALGWRGSGWRGSNRRGPVAGSLWSRLRLAVRRPLRNAPRARMRLRWRVLRRG